MSTGLRTLLLCSALTLGLSLTGCASTGSSGSSGYTGYANVVEVGDTLYPAPGYVWIYPNDPDNYQVRWQPGVEHSNHDHVVAGQEENTWRPAPGYRWVRPNDNDDLRVVPQ